MSKLKRKGCYWFPESDEDYEGVWNKDFSQMIVQKGISKVLIEGWSAEAAVYLSTDPYDFMKREKTRAGDKFFIGSKEITARTTRYYVSTKGEPAKKVAPPKGDIGDFKRKNGLSDSEYNKIKSQIPPGTWDERIHTKNKSKYEARESSVEAGYLIKECNNISEFDWNDVDFKYYIDEIEKLRII